MRVQDLTTVSTSTASTAQVLHHVCAEWGREVQNRRDTFSSQSSSEKQHKFVLITVWRFKSYAICKCTFPWKHVGSEVILNSSSSMKFQQLFLNIHPFLIPEPLPWK